jgi:Flp pilus assembly pilin Flp
MNVSLLIRLLIEDEGQDLVEYALLTGVIAIGSVAAITAIGPVIQAVYQSWDTETQNRWEPQAPAGS